MRIVLFFVLFCSAFSVIGQINYDYDTIVYGDRTNGIIDSMDVRSGDLPTTFDGGISVLSSTGLSTQTLLRQLTQPNFNSTRPYGKMHFSALPHLGFSYSFGGQGAQFLKARYTQAFTDKLVLDLSYDRNVGLGTIRNADFKENDVAMQLQYKGKRYSTLLQGMYRSWDVSHSGGLLTDTLIESFGLEFATVNKSNAFSKNRIGDVHWLNYFNFTNDSINGLGLLTTHDYTIHNREYTESDTLYGIYDNVYLDSASTRDQYNVATIRSGAGAYYASSKFYVHGAIDYGYWEYTNIGISSDSTEIDFSSKLRLSLGKSTLKNGLRMNLLGRYNDFANNASIDYKKAALTLQGRLDIENKAPSVIQRYYTGNHSNYTLANIQNQSWIRARLAGEYAFWGNRIKLGVFGDYTSVSRVYAYTFDGWTTDSVALNFSSLGLSSDFNLGVFHIQPTLIYSTDTEGYLPGFQGKARAYVKGKLFEAKKLEVVFGVDFSYVSAFRTRTYIPYMDTYNWIDAPSVSSAPLTNLHAFLTLGINEFRFFFRYENIGYFWSDKTTQVVSGYPISGPRLRVGLTWDFFN